MPSSSDDDDAASTARKALKRLSKALAALPPRDEQRNALPPAARASCDVAAAFALCAALHAKNRLVGGGPVHAELQRCKALMVRARAAEAELRPRVDAAAAARHVAGALGAQPRHDDAARAAANDEAALRALLRDARRTAEFDEACAPPAPPPRPPVAPPAAAPGASLLAGASFRLAKRLRKR
jgi:hypothetical protein